MIFLAISGLSLGQTATATIGDYTQAPGTLTIPVTVSNFNNVAAVTIYFQYDPAVVTYTGFNSPGLTGLDANAFTSNGIHKVGITWSASGASGSNLTGTLVNIVFNYIGGSGDFNFLASECEITDNNYNTVTVLYSDGSISPVSSATVSLPTLTNQTPGNPFNVPLNVNFSTVTVGVSNFTYIIEYDNTKLIYQSIANTALTGITVTQLNNPARLAIEWTDAVNPGSKLNGKLLDIVFSYVGGDSPLTFDEANCVMTDYDNNDVPTTYTNGSVSQNPASIVNVTAGTESALPGTEVLVPVTVGNFTNIGAFDLLIDHDLSVLGFVGLVNIHPNLIPTATLSSNATATGLGINWTSTTAGVTIPNGEKLFDMKFNYTSGTTALTFNTILSEISDFSLNILTVNYTNGSVSELTAAASATLPDVMAAPLSDVEIPVTVKDFTNIGAFDFAISYDAGVLTFEDVVDIHPDVAGARFLYNAAGSKVYTGWSIDPSAIIGIDVDDDDTLFKIRFNYIAGTSELVFDQAKSEVTNFDDETVIMTYTDGSVSGGNELALTLFPEGFYNSGTGLLNKTKDDVGGVLVDKFPGTVVDTVSVELHDAADYSRIIHTIYGVEIHTDGTATAMIPSTYLGNYYITIRSRNHLETVSGTAQSFASTRITYNFSDVKSAAFGSNLKEIAPGVFGIFAGDVNQDGYVNTTDRSSVNSKVIAIYKGYVAEDVNGDGSVNTTDRSIVNSGVISIVQRIIP